MFKIIAFYIKNILHFKIKTFEMVISLRVEWSDCKIKSQFHLFELYFYEILLQDFM